MSVSGVAPEERQRSRRARAMDLALALLLFLLAGEITTRVANPKPRIQVWDERVVPVTELDGVPYWRMRPDEAAPLEGFDCTADHHVILAGDSVFYLTDDQGQGVEADNVVGFLRRSYASRSDLCFHNVSEVGFGPVQQIQRAREAVDRVGPSLVILQVFKPDPAYLKIGPRWYDFGVFRRDEVGLPAIPLVSGLLPGALKRQLFERSALWRLGTWTLAPTTETHGENYHAFLSDDRWSRGGRVLLETPTMDGPFEAYLERRKTSFFPALQADAVARGVPYIVFAEQLLGQPPEALRTDPCCHVHARGHALMAQAMMPFIDAAFPMPEDGGAL